MKIYKVEIAARCQYLYDRDYDIKACSEATAASRAIKKFWQDATNKKRKRRTNSMTIKINLK
jgi:hypothetical protein